MLCFTIINHDLILHEVLLRIWPGARNYQLDMLDKLQKRVCETVGQSLAASLELLAHG